MYRSVIIRTVDTDVVVLAVSTFSKIAPNEMWVAFGVKSSFQYIAIHEMVASMNPTQCLTLPVFHAFTGCDTVSSTEVSEESMFLLERFVVLMYDRTSESMEVNDARKQLFSQKSINSR